MAQPQSETIISMPTPPSTIDLPPDSDTSISKTDLPFNEQTNYVSTRKIITIFLACASVDLVSLIDQTTLAVALPIIASELSAGSQSSWVVNGHFIASTSFQLLYGRISDIFSRKHVLLAGLVIFFLGNLFSSVSPTINYLIAFRAFTGIGGGGLVTIAQIIISDVVTLRERGKYQGILGAVVAISNGVGPIIGGALAGTGKQGWRWIFRLNLPVSVLTGTCVVFFMPLRKVEGDWKAKLRAVDYLGIILTLLGSTLICLGFTWAGGDHAWNSVFVIAPIVLGVFVSGCFVFWEWKWARFPLMPVHIFKTKMVNGACLTMFINGWNFFIQIYYIPTFYQMAYGYGAVHAGSLLLPLLLVQTLASTLSGLYISHVNRYRSAILLGWVTWTTGLALYSTLAISDVSEAPNSGALLAKQIGYGALTGLGVGCTLQSSLVALQAGVERRNMGVVTGVRNFMRNLGGTFGLAISSTIINIQLSRSLRSLPPSLSKFSASSGSREVIQTILNSPLTFLTTTASTASTSSYTFSEVEISELQNMVLSSYAQGFRIVFILGSSLAGLATILAWWLMPELGLDRRDDEKLKQEAKERGLSKGKK